MRVDRFHVDGFGIFADREFGPLAAPVTVFYGPNEAGKSTLLAFVRTMLFGFPARLRADHYPPLGGGSHGGRAWLVDDRSVRYEVARSESVRGTVLEVTASNGEVSNDPAFVANVLGRASKDMFESVFAFSLSELQQFESISKGDASAQIYAAGMGAAKLPGALADLENRRQALFKPGGSNQKVAQVLSELEGVDAKLREIGNTADRYATLVKQRDALRKDVDALHTTLKDLREQQAHLLTLQRARDDWAPQRSLGERLAELPEFPNFPVDAAGRLEKIEERVRTASAELHRSEDELEAAEAAVDAAAGDTSILAHQARIESLRRGRQSFDESVRDAPKREGELTTSRDEFQTGLRALGPGWDEQRVDAFDMSIPIRDTINSWTIRLADAQNAARTAASDVEHAGRTSKDAAEAVQDLERAQEGRARPPYSAEQLDERRRQIRVCRGLLGELQVARARIRDLNAQVEAVALAAKPTAAAPQRAMRLPAALLAGGGIVAIAAGFALGGSAAVLGGVLGLLALLGAGALLLAGRVPVEAPQAAPRPGAALLADAQRAAEELQARLSEAATLLGVANTDQAAIDAVEEQFQRDDALLRDWTQAEHQLAEARKAAGKLAQRASEHDDDAGEARSRQVETQDEWRAWLSERGLDQSLLPHTVEAVFVQVESARQLARNVASVADRLGGIERDIANYAAPVVAVAAEHGVAVEVGDPRSVAAAADELIQRFEAARRAAETQTQAGRKFDEAQLQFDNRGRDAKEAGHELDALLELGSARTAEELRRNAETHDERKDVERQLRDCKDRLQRLAGSPQALARLEAELATTDFAALDAEIAGLSQQVEDVDKQRAELAEKLGGVSNELESLTNEEETSKMRARREVLRTDLEATAREWSVLTVARALLLEAQRQYEKDHQPGVILNASQFFQSFTGGRYSDLLSPLGSQKLTVADRNGVRKEPDQLSRGTQEQLYLALRFGLIRQFGEQACNLPVIVDEVLVNFDPDRARRAAEGFVELAKTNQVLVFTCHPSMVEIFKNACPTAQVIEINGDA